MQNAKNQSQLRKSQPNFRTTDKVEQPMSTGGNPSVWTVEIRERQCYHPTAASTGFRLANCMITATSRRSV